MHAKLVFIFYLERKMWDRSIEKIRLFYPSDHYLFKSSSFSREKKSLMIVQTWVDLLKTTFF